MNDIFVLFFPLFLLAMFLLIPLLFSTRYSNEDTTEEEELEMLAYKNKKLELQIEHERLSKKLEK